MDKQELRNALSDVEDIARANRKHASSGELVDVLTLIARLAQIVREEIVK